MKKLFFGTIILCLLHSLLIVNQDLGINVLLLTLPLLFFIVFMMKENKAIKNKYGLLFVIPILLLSTTYFVYDNTFKYLNGIVIPILYLLLYIFTIKPVDTISDTIVELLNLLVKPLNYIDKYTKEIVELIPKKSKQKVKKKKDYRVLKSLLIVIPIVIVVLMLLSSADSIFGSIFKLDFELPNIDEAFIRILRFVLLFFILGSTICFVSKEYIKEKRVKNELKEKDPLTINMLLIVLDIIYVIFDIIQINSLMLHRVASGFNYAEYARSGFFQLMLISFINISIILLSKRSKEEAKTKVLSIVMVVLTLIIIYSSYYRMSLYEIAYGYTVLRLGVYAILLTEAILMLPTIYYIINKNIKIMYFYLIITVVMYSVINCFSVDRIIASNNIERYNKTGKIDIYYLENKNYDNLNQLRDLYNLRIYIGKMDKRNKQTLFGYNLSKEKAKEKRD